MKQLLAFIVILSFCIQSNGQLAVNPTGKFFNYQGIKIYYEDNGTGEPLLLLHSFYSTADQWKPFIETYAKQFRTIAVDMVGHGRSAHFQSGDINFRHAAYAKIVLALLDSLKLDKINAIGASSGGMTLFHLNTMQPQRFRAVITVGAQIYFSKFTREVLIKKGPDSLNTSFMDWAPKQHGAEKAKFLARQFWQFRQLYGDPAFTPDILGTITADWLVVQGDDDEYVPLQQALEMDQYIPKSWLWIVPKGGHFPHLIPGHEADFLKRSLEFFSGDWNKKP